MECKLLLLGGICFRSNKNKQGKRLGWGLLLSAVSPTGSPLWERLTMRTTVKYSVVGLQVDSHQRLCGWPTASLILWRLYLYSWRATSWCVCTVLCFISDGLNWFRKYAMRPPPSNNPHWLPSFVIFGHRLVSFIYVMVIFCHDNNYYYESVL